MIVPLANNYDGFSAKVLKDLIRAAESGRDIKSPAFSDKLENLRVLSRAVFDVDHNSALGMARAIYKHFVFSFIVGVKPDHTYRLLTLLHHPTFTMVSETGNADLVMITMSLDGWIDFVLAQNLEDWSQELAKQLRNHFEKNGFSYLFVK